MFVESFHIDFDFSNFTSLFNGYWLDCAQDGKFNFSSCQEFLFTNILESDQTSFLQIKKFRNGCNVGICAAAQNLQIATRHLNPQMVKPCRLTYLANISLEILSTACLTFCLLLTDRPTLGLPEYKL